ncbi:hypothetical protein E8E12_005154 [Didymella heteroderae]|uniref:Uncharacterized protein n=1 Tax=Didymella heteroderae TaxID=1769908 RepID=A0A9P4WQY1_9PLEO|nr:hypothetical protein E8E12_005154 [Didymella heteroderae]
MSSPTPFVYTGPAPFFTRSIKAAAIKAKQESLRRYVRAALGIFDASEHAKKPRARPSRVEKRPALEFTLHNKSVKTVRKFVPESEKGPDIRFTLHLRGLRTVKRYLPAEKVKVQISEEEMQDVEQQIKRLREEFSEGL